MPQIRVLSGVSQGLVLNLEDRELTVGRDPTCDIPLNVDSPASRQHAKIFKTGKGWCIKDLGSMNGTEVNSRRVDEHFLKTGDSIAIGGSVFVFDEQESGNTDRSIAGTPDESILARVKEMSIKTRLIEAEISKAIIGQKEIIWELLTAIISRGHVLMIGMPGIRSKSRCP